MSDPSENLIQFHSGVPDMRDPKPYRAAGGVPEWLKDMPPQVPAVEGGAVNTVKVCMPFVDAMSCGYVIPLRSAVRFFMRSEQQLEFDHPEWEAYGQGVTDQPSAGYQGSPFGQKLVIKFINNWIIQTPPGYSTLFVPLLNQFNMPFHVLAGLVDTDRYYRLVHFPAICLLAAGASCVLPRGTPLVQAIPVKRDAWRAEFDVWDVSKHHEAEAPFKENPHHYRDEIREKKDYR